MVFRGLDIPDKLTIQKDRIIQTLIPIIFTVLTNILKMNMTTLTMINLNQIEVIVIHQLLLRDHVQKAKVLYRNHLYYSVQDNQTKWFFGPPSSKIRTRRRNIVLHSPVVKKSCSPCCIYFRFSETIFSKCRY